MLFTLRPSHHLSLRRFFCKNSAPEMAPYREAFARRMAMAGIKPHHRIAIGVSGGPDSMALCVLTAGWKSTRPGEKNEALGFIDGLLGIVVDHRLRAESAEEANLVKERVSKLGIKCEVRCCEWSRGRPRQGHLQERAREMRYQIFQGVCIENKIGVLLIAHHADDQAELFILRLSRNSGVLGLAGMAFVSQLFPTHSICCLEPSHGILLVRPMLEFSKDDMYKICKGGYQEWVEDPTNASSLFARNRLRISLRSVSSCLFKSEMQRVIAACRSTRLFVEKICHKMIEHAVIIVDHGYAIIDLEKLEPSNIEDLCLSKFLGVILQFVSQRHRPIRGSVSQQLLNYIRNFPCKTSFTAAGCYLCAAPRSKGRKLLVCFSPDSPQPPLMPFSLKYSSDKRSYLLREVDQIITEARSYSDQSFPDASTVPFLHAKSSEAILSEAKNLNLISDSTFTTIHMLQMKEHSNFNSKTEVEPENNGILEMKSAHASQITLHSGDACHFMSRFLVMWKLSKDTREDEFLSRFNNFDKKSVGGQEHRCQFCMIDQEMSVAVRYMTDADWLYLANLAKGQTLEDCRDHTDTSLCELEQNAGGKVQCSSYMQLSAQKALQALKAIPVSARRALPVLVDSHDLLLSIPSICFQCCPGLSAVAIFRPRVPLGGGYSSYI